MAERTPNGSAGEEGAMEFKSMLFTGGCGFIGSNVMLYLLKANPEMKVLNLDKMDYSSRHPDIPEDIKPRYTFERANICDTKKMLNLLQKHEIDVVVHSKCLCLCLCW